MNEPMIIAEFTTNHMGNLNVLLRMVEKAKEAGADIIKMQWKNVRTFYSQEKLASSFPSPYGKTYEEYRTIFEFDEEDWAKFDRKCNELAIPWYSTIQDTAASYFFKQNYPDMPFIKLASCNASNQELMQVVKQSWPGTPVIFSVGGIGLKQIQRNVDFFDDRQVIIQQCTSAYPCPYEDLYLGNIRFLQDHFSKRDNVSVGYSGHELGWAPSLLAAHMGAATIERHFCLSRHSFVHHIECSLEPEEFAEMVRSIRSVEKMTGVGFGLKDREKRFLIDGSYSGTDFLKGGSKI